MLKIKSPNKNPEEFQDVVVEGFENNIYCSYLAFDISLIIWNFSQLLLWTLNIILSQQQKIEGCFL